MRICFKKFSAAQVRADSPARFLSDSYKTVSGLKSLKKICRKLADFFAPARKIFPIVPASARGRRAKFSFTRKDRSESLPILLPHFKMKSELKRERNFQTKFFKAIRKRKLRTCNSPQSISPKLNFPLSLPPMSRLQTRIKNCGEKISTGESERKNARQISTFFQWILRS
ncbi:MAG: hypothetical protein DBX55_10560 [Verrucomicrobia bacterium]|nr:MAG: hypothetical protein DBX55_10560 [Verrucomicrobiota bacterium]